jgi:hypothetical protein
MVILSKMAVNYCGICFKTLAHGPNVIKLFTTLIYLHSMVMPSFCAIKLNDLGNYSGMAVNYHGVCETNAIKHNLT